jgi:hypothetical protein
MNVTQLFLYSLAVAESIEICQYACNHPLTCYLAIRSLSPLHLLSFNKLTIPLSPNITPLTLIVLLYQSFMDLSDDILALALPLLTVLASIRQVLIT